jgi:hypothetical protein
MIRSHRTRIMTSWLSCTVAAVGLASALLPEPAHGQPVPAALSDTAAARTPIRQFAVGDRDLPRGLSERWRRNILDEIKIRYCDSENGEEVGWLISPILDGFYYGYLDRRSAMDRPLCRLD